MDYKKIGMLAEQYEENREVYDDFTSKISGILKSVLNTHSIRHQVVTDRVKEYPSIKEKVLAGKVPENIETIFDIDDISGCRVIFYLESDIQRFSNLLYDELMIEKDNLIYTEDGYNARHLIVRCKSEDPELTDFEKFKNLKCEIQLTTVLFHAWSEMSHNILYKLSDDVSKFDEQSVNVIREQFEDVMKSHIKPASYTFDYLNERYERILEGKNIFEYDFLQGILLSSSRNELYEKINLLHKYIIEFGDKTPNEFNLFDFIPKAIEQSKALSNDGIERPLGRLFRTEHYYVAEVCLDILNHIRYINIEETLKILIEQILKSEEKISKKATEILNNLTRYNLKVMNKIGYAPQLRMLEIIEKYSFDSTERVWNIYSTLISNLLKLEFDDTTLTDYKQISITTGTLGLNARLKEVRNRAIDLLEEIYQTNSDVSARVSVMNKFMEVSNLPNRTEYDQTLEEMVIENTVRVLQWMLDNFREFHFKEIKVIENNLYRFKKLIPDSKEIKKISDLINDNQEYEIYRTLVGSDLNYNKDIGWREAEKIRTQKTDKLVECVSSESYEEWEQRILYIANCYEDKNNWEFRNFKRFLFEIGKQKIEVAEKIITDNEEKIEYFLAHMVAGIWRVGEKRKATRFLRKWIEEKKYLRECAEVFLLVDTPDTFLLKDILRSIKESNNFNSLFVFLQAILRHEEHYHVLNTLFIQTVTEFVEKERYDWTNLLWFDENSILNYLTEEEYKQLLSHLTRVNNIDVHEEEILKRVSLNDPKKVVSFFYSRVERTIENSKDSLLVRYSPVPHNFYSLGDILRDKSKEILSEIIKWFDKDGYYFKAEAAQFIKNIYPDFESELENFLTEKVVQGTKEDAKNVLSIIKEYEGDLRTHEVCKRVVRKYYGDEELMRELLIALTQTGIVSGEYGFVEKYEQIKREVRKWQKKEQSQEIKNFVKKFVDHINRRIIQERRRADRNIEMMQREFRS